MSNAQSGIYTSIGIVKTHINFWACRYFRRVPKSARFRLSYRFCCLQGGGKQAGISPILGIHARCGAFIGVISLKMFKCAISKLQPIPKTGEKSKMNSTDIKVENILHLWYAYREFCPNAYAFSVKNKS